MITKMVKIKWLDSNIYNEQGSINDDLKIATIESVGYLLKENEDSIAIARDLIGDDSRGTLVIPKVCILERYDIIKDTKRV